MKDDLLTPAAVWADPLRDSAPLVDALAEALRARDLRLATGESCTGGLIAACCTAVAGSSDWFERGVVTYSNQAKSELLGVPPELITWHGAVSEPVAAAMAHGLLRYTPAHVGVAITGIAGPGGGSVEKPVGTVWLGLAWRGRAVAGVGEQVGETGTGVQTWRLQCSGDRHAVRNATVRQALLCVLQRLQDSACTKTLPAK